MDRFFYIIFVLFAIGCTPSNNDRCDGWEYKDGTCHPLVDTADNRDTDTDTIADTDNNISVETDDNADNSGTICTEGACDGPATYCLIGMGETQGYCTHEDCTTGSCPTDYTCCVDFTFTQTSFCVKDAEYGDISSLCGGQ